jgi:HK97 family phage portal protein
MKLEKPIVPRERVGIETARSGVRFYPTQKTQGQMYRAPRPAMREHAVTYAMNAWVYTAASRLAESAAEAEMLVHKKGDPLSVREHHPLARMLGRLGMPNDLQDAYEFMTLHYLHLALSGNSYWYWYSERGGRPEQVYLLDPRYMAIQPGKKRSIAAYHYNEMGEERTLLPEQVTHFRRPNPYSRYYGLSAVTALMLELVTDRHQVQWNHDRFEDGVVYPSGILVVPEGTDHAEIERLRTDLQDANAGGRRTHVLSAAPGATVWLDAGMKPQDGDFVESRNAMRKMVYETLELPLGLMSESSTEAHALVAKQQLAQAVTRRHIRTKARLNADVLNFWPGHRGLEVGFEDVSRKHIDWRREILLEQFLAPFRTPNEVRAKFGLPKAAVEEAEVYGFESQAKGGAEITDEVQGGASASVRPGSGGESPDADAEEDDERTGQ